MAQDRIAQIRDLLKDEQNFEPCGYDADLEEQQVLSHKYRDLLLKLKYILSSVLSEKTLEMLNDLDLSIHNMTAVSKARAHLHGLLPDIEDELKKYEKIYDVNTASIEAYGQNGEYSTPYLDLMIRAIRELGINNDNQLKKWEVEEWFEKQTYFKVSPKEIDKLASFVRLPKMKAGKNKTGTQKKVGTH